MGTESRSTVVAAAILADDHLLVSSYNPATRFLLQSFSNAFHGYCTVHHVGFSSFKEAVIEIENRELSYLVYQRAY